MPGFLDVTRFLPLDVTILFIQQLNSVTLIQGLYNTGVGFIIKTQIITQHYKTVNLITVIPLYCVHFLNVSHICSESKNDDEERCF